MNCECRIIWDFITGHWMDARCSVLYFLWFSWKSLGEICLHGPPLCIFKFRSLKPCVKWGGGEGERIEKKSSERKLKASQGLETKDA